MIKTVVKVRRSTNGTISITMKKKYPLIYYVRVVTI
jgi:hypothetical protein